MQHPSPNRSNSKKVRCFWFFLAFFFFVLPFLTSYPGAAIQMLIYAIFALGYDILFGYAALPSLGHAAFFGLGAYGLGLILNKLHAPFVVAFMGGIFLSLIAAFVIGLLTVHRKGIYFVMVTLAFNQLIYFIVFKWTSLTGGADGLHGIPRPAIGPIHLTSEISFYYFVLCFFVLSAFLAIRIVNSPFGKTLQCIKANEDRAKSIGFNIKNFKLISFLISAFFSGLAGTLYGLHLNFVPIATLGFITSGDVLIMCLIGGVGTLYGPVFGAMLLTYFKSTLSGLTEHWNLIMGTLFIISILRFRGGILPKVKERLWRKTLS